MKALVGVLLGETDAENATALAEVTPRCPYCVVFTHAEGTVVGVFAIPSDHRWWLEWVEAQPRETLGLRRAEIFLAQKVEASSPWTCGQVQATLERAPCGAECLECRQYRGKCQGCPATVHYLGV